MPLAIIIILILIIVALLAYNLSISKKIENFNSINQKITNLNILQDFMNTISEVTSVNEKIQKINNILIERYNIKYSTIVVYNGTEYVIKASNVDKKHWEVLRNLQSEETFKDSIQSAIPKYITIEKEGERLPYQKMEFERAKSAIFFPLYIDNVYIGYWIIEGSKPHEFDNIDTTILEVVKNNIVSVLKTVEKQQIIENIVREDKLTKLKSAEYLFGEGKRTIDKYTTSTVCLFKITNLEEINETIGRKIGNEIVTKVSEKVKQDLSDEYIFVRYMGPKFAIVFSGIEMDAIVSFMSQVKEKVENIKITVDKNKEAIPKINVVLSTYYKGTALEGLTKKLEEYLDTASNNENTINYL
ncbi:diguanylate cyclase (GGDEF) domain-containing protein [Clostridium sp. CAG:567]|nr:diguanylate cyclase (GGDEF) domain-containing protein [Clostridium sp. CAG:567]